MDEVTHEMSDGELSHYGVLGMKWGVTRAARKQAVNPRLYKKALNYDKKSAVLTRKSERAHSKYDLESSNKYAKKAATYDIKSATAGKKALKTDNELKKTAYHVRSESLKYKAAKARIKANSISKSKGYGLKAMNYSIKSDKAAAKAALARKKLANNDRYIAMMKRKVSSLSAEEIRGGYSFVSKILDD